MKSPKTTGWLLVIATVFGMTAAPCAARQADCTGTSTGLVPLNMLGTGQYLGAFEGGLYPGGLNTPPAAHHTEGQARAAAVERLDTAGVPNPSGAYVLLSIGMSNTTQEFCCHNGTLMGRAVGDARVEHFALRIMNGAAGGRSAAFWDNPADPDYNRVRDNVLAPQGLTEAQVQAVWMKVANPGPMLSLPNAGADAFTLVTQMGNIARALKTRYPNLQIIFASSRIYAGYAGTMLNPEPYAYESGFAVKWLIEAQVRQMQTGMIDPRAGDLNYDTGTAPFIAWGPYLWADGTTPRVPDGLLWNCPDLEAGDGTHPSASGEGKVGTMLLDHLLFSPYAAPWFRAAPPTCPGDADRDGMVGLSDIAVVITQWGRVAQPGQPHPTGDLTNEGQVGLPDVAFVIENWGACP